MKYICAKEHEFESEHAPTCCPTCDEGRQTAKRNQYISNSERENRNMSMRGIATSDRQRLCEGCNMPLKGYSEAVYNEDTGATMIECSNCGHEHEVFQNADRWGSR